MIYRHLATNAEANQASQAFKPVTTLCGNEWTPQRGFQDDPTCPTCTRIALGVSA